MLLAIDIGNTNIALGVFQDKTLVERWKIKSEADRTCDEYYVLLKGLFAQHDHQYRTDRSRHPFKCSASSYACISETGSEYVPRQDAYRRPGP